MRTFLRVEETHMHLISMRTGGTVGLFHVHIILFLFVTELNVATQFTLFRSLAGDCLGDAGAVVNVTTADGAELTKVFALIPTT